MIRVAITGIGCVTAFGAGRAALERGLREAECAIGEMTLFSTEGFRTHRAAVAPDPALDASTACHVARRLSRTDRLGVAAALEAAGQSAIVGGLRPEAIGVWMGGTTGGMFEAEAFVSRWSRGEYSWQAPGQLPSMPVHTTAAAVAQAVGARGPRRAISTACSSSANSIGLAADAIREGRVEAAIAGGAESHCRMTFAGFNALQAVDPDCCRPFDRRRAGLSLGDGAAFVVLEAESAARARGAEILGYVAGWGASADAHHMTAPDPEAGGASLAMRRALADAGLQASDVDYVNAHGTGTPQNDPIETRAIRNVLGPHADRVPVSSTKSQLGHCLGAAGAIEIAATLLALRAGFVPPTLGLEEPDESCDLDYVPGASRRADARTALSNSYGFGGNDTSVVVQLP